MQKQELSPISSLQSYGDVSPVPEEEELELKTIFTSPLTTRLSHGANSMQSTQRKKKKTSQVLELTDKLYNWNNYLTRKFVNTTPLLDKI